MRSTFTLAVTLVALLATASFAAITEVEPNSAKTQANAGFLTGPGDFITGTSTGSDDRLQYASLTSADYFDVTMPPAPLGIYRHRLVIRSMTPGHTATIHGTSQFWPPADTLLGIPWDGVVGTPAPFYFNTIVQTSPTAPPRFNQWYGFGKQERFIYRVTGGTTTTAPYVATLETVPVTPVFVGVFWQGRIDLNWIGQGHSTDTEMWVYDRSTMTAIRGYGNSDASGPLGGAPVATGTIGSFQSFLSREYAPGEYCIALSDLALANDQAAPSDDLWRIDQLLDYPNMVLNGSKATGLDLTFTITDFNPGGSRSVVVPNVKAGPYDVNWFCFQVVPEPSAWGMLLLGLSCLVAARRC